MVTSKFISLGYCLHAPHAVANGNCVVTVIQLSFGNKFHAERWLHVLQEVKTASETGDFMTL